VVVGEKGYAGGEEEEEDEATGRGRVVEEDGVPRYPVIDEHETRATTKKRRKRSSPPVGRVVAKVEDKGVRVAKVAGGTREPEGTNGRNTTDTPTTKQVTTTTRVITPRMDIIMTKVIGTATTSIPIRIIIPRVDEEEVGVVASDGDVDAEVVDAVADEVPVMPVHRKTAAMLPPTSSHRTVKTRRSQRRPRQATIPHR